MSKNHSKMALSSLLIFISACSEEVVATQEMNWQQLCPGEQFCFEHPATLIDQKLAVIDSNSGQLTDGIIELNYDFGWYSSLYNHLINPTIEKIEIDGREANIITSNNVIAIVVPSVRDNIRFSMSIDYKNESDLIMAKKIFASVTFK